MKALRLLFADTFKVSVAPISLDIMDIFNSFPSTLISATHSVRRGKWGGGGTRGKVGGKYHKFQLSQNFYPLSYNFIKTVQIYEA